MNRRALLLSAGGLALAPSALAHRALAHRQSEALQLWGPRVQGGAIIGRTRPRATIMVDGEALATASARGFFIVGLDRDAPASTTIEVRDGVSTVARQSIQVARGDFAVQRVDGLPPSTVTPTDPALLARIQREAAVKAEGFASRTDLDHFIQGFVWPLTSYRVSSRFGAQRILNGTPARPHYGIDLATPAGTEIRAPAPGLVTLAERDLHFEGGLTLIDHGQGLISAYLHQSRLLVSRGDVVSAGQPIGRVGATGRATGPHLCWRLKWRDRNLDPSLLVGVRAPGVIGID
ncbi:MAG: M23 family metallopeptidase [Brevundimonas sp.]|uniref:M23 family metallopeptidase n=1 Tax=Brevundimonas sp. TaxID=1871086 RepID=UPI00391D2BF5